MMNKKFIKRLGKKVLPVVAALSISGLSSVGLAFAQGELVAELVATAGTISGQPGDTVQVPVSVKIVPSGSGSFAATNVTVSLGKDVQTLSFKDNETAAKEVTLSYVIPSTAVSTANPEVSMSGVQPSLDNGTGQGQLKVINGKFDSISIQVVSPTPTPVVDTTAPVVTAPDNLTVEATNVTTIIANLGTATADEEATIVNNAPAAFPLGKTSVKWTATDSSGNIGTATQIITIVDTTKPVFTTLPTDVSTEASAIQTLVDLEDATATDIFDVKVANDAPTDSAFPLGETKVTWTATDSSGNVATVTQLVTIVDTTKPVFSAFPADVIQEATAIENSVNLGTAAATDIFEVNVSNNASATFGYGPTNVVWTAKDANGNFITKTQIVEITDTTKPVFISVPKDTIKLLGTNKDQIGMATATDIFGVTVTNDAPEVFKLGENIVTWTATDGHGLTATAKQIVTINYNFGGILQPINSDGKSTFKAGSTIPVKFQLTDANGVYVSNAVASIQTAKYSNAVLGTSTEAISTSAATTGNLFRYDATANQYIFNLSTKGMTVGTYKITISLSDGTKQTVDFSLR